MFLFCVPFCIFNLFSLILCVKFLLLNSVQSANKADWAHGGQSRVIWDDRLATIYVHLACVFIGGLQLVFYHQICL